MGGGGGVGGDWGGGRGGRREEMLCKINSKIKVNIQLYFITRSLQCLNDHSSIRLSLMSQVAFNCQR